MKNSGYSPGPWRRQGQIIWSKQIARKVAHVHTEKGEPLQDNANAKLIRTAPEMLEILELCSRTLLSDCPEQGPVNELVDRIIAKAKGEGEY